MKYRSIVLAGIAIVLGMTAAAQTVAAGSALTDGSSLISATAAVAPSVAASPSPAELSSSVTATPPVSTPGLQLRNPRYKLRKGDSFDVDFAMTPEFNQVVAVQPDGYITLKSIGSMYVEGQTVPELTLTLTNAYTRILHEPVIAVSLKDFEKPFFIASGEVARPGKYDLRGDLTVTEGVAIAGGFDDKSKHSQVVLFHPVPTGGFEARIINVKKLMASRDMSEDIRLQPGDMLFVPQNSLSKIKPFLPSSSVSAFMGPGVL
jgi:polysaccharide export outer membrane protein